MQVQFVRTGGFAGPATSVTGTLTFDGASAHVASDGTGYHRDLPSSEAEPLQASLRQAALKPAQPAPESSSLPDAYEYRITITAEDGKTRTLTLRGNSSVSPEAAQMVQWIQQETQSIWQYRLQHRP